MDTEAFTKLVFILGLLLGLMVGVGAVLSIQESKAVTLSAIVSENICNSNLDILRECCK